MNIVPRSKGPLILLASQIHATLVELGEQSFITYNHVGAVANDLHALTGPPGMAEQGALARFDAAKSATASAFDANHAAIEAGRAFAMKAIGILKNTLGTRWNARWQAVGFAGGSLAIPKNPLSVIVGIGAYLRLNPAHGSAQFDVTGDAAEAISQTLVARRQAVDSARSAQAAAGAAYNEALKRLKQRVSAFRAELELLLDDDDERWFLFGFSRPVDGRGPAPVEGLTVRAGGPGEFVAEWKRSARAKTYRISRQVEGADAEPVMLGLVSEPVAIVRGLPLGAVVRVSVSARNKTGETQPSTVEFIVPNATPATVKMPAPPPVDHQAAVTPRADGRESRSVEDGRAFAREDASTAEFLA
ncbi:MAG TPA: fibronectin type III domain-containing protein [Chthoniobacteraceae bacterium]|nr:fibronectin type III domain-containing protein [Chthoniobacteraceae bacterium]